VILDLVNSENKLAGQAYIAPAMSQALNVGLVDGRLSSTEILDSDGGRVCKDLAVDPIQMGVSVADLLRLGNHMEHGCLGSAAA
jgi:hypothetical protein